ncbi:prepilin-type N-terminal cleavage/methylation domain-containing protein [Calothrix sp. NIES-2098]|uniref:prepilin-type N-terminal cleavage/methylation domain-containing protein n=1 Tax=Calothrix sp. NIES-2098 TaxID=1954171 RepID=UPI000B60145F|nr:hypothetical protein NIES2098_60080 [Calothrix sp. NIES-2098]
MNNFSRQLLSRSKSDRASKDLLTTKQDGGFTLLEMLVVVLIVGILTAIAAPSWLGFVNRQRLSKASDNLVAALQEAQRQAKISKRNYSVSFKNNNLPEFSIHRADTTPTIWKKLGADVGIQAGQLILGTNISATNTLSSPNTVAFDNLSTAKSITFDYMGILAAKTDGSTSDIGLKVVVKSPNSSNVKRCVVLQTLIGGVRTAKDTECN